MPGTDFIQYVFRKSFHINLLKSYELIANNDFHRRGMFLNSDQTGKIASASNITVVGVSTTNTILR